MKDLSEVRKEIDSIDDELVKLYTRRMQIVGEVADAKRATGKAVFDPARERAILQRVSEKVGLEHESGARLLFSTLFNISRARQREVLSANGKLSDLIAESQEKTPKAFPGHAVVACQGTEGAYSQQATSRLFAFPQIVYFKGFDDVFTAVEKGECSYGVLPIENSNAGSVTAVYDLMVKHNFRIVRSIRQKIDHVLMAPKGVKLEDIREVSSHPQALAQCSDMLNEHRDWVVTPGVNTALAAKTMMESGRRDMAVIASRVCAELYGLDVIADDIANTAMNYTRFICISKNLEIYPDAKKFTIQLSLPHKPGALYYVMAKFASIDVNVTKLESRPIPGMDFEFRFTFDFEASPSDPRVLRLLNELADDPEIVRFTFLGAYSES